jgi:hypothetical protein
VSKKLADSPALAAGAGFALAAALMAARSVIASKRSATARTPPPSTSGDEATVPSKAALIKATDAPSPDADSPTSTRPAAVRDLGGMVLKYAVLGAAAGALLLAFRALTLVGFDLKAASALVSGPSATTALQILVQEAPYVGLILSAALAYQGGRITKAGTPEHTGADSWNVAAPVLLLALALVAPAIALYPTSTWWTSLITLAVPSGAYFQGRSKHGWSYFTVLFGIGVLVIVHNIYAGGPWLPRERLTVQGTDYVAYVVSDSEDTLSVYLPANKAVLRLKTEEIERRQFCGDEEPVQTIGSLWQGVPILPPCPNVDKPFPFK